MTRQARTRPSTPARSPVEIPTAHPHAPPSEAVRLPPRAPEAMRTVQQRAGNRAARALRRAAVAPPLARGVSSAATVREAPMHRLQRAWVATSESGVEEWDAQVGSKTWRRRAGAGGYEYYYTVTSGSGDVEWEMEWHAAAWYADKGVPVPPALSGATAEVTLVEEDDSDDEYEAQWDLDRFFAEISSKGVAGVCNAMTAAYLMNFIDPDVDTSGMTAVIFEKTLLLKGLLDYVTTFYSSYDSSDVTYGFVTWGQAMGLTGDWLGALDDSSVDEAAASFREWFHQAREALPPRAMLAMSGPYTGMSLEGLATQIDDMLEPWFDMRRSFQGVVVIKAQKEGLPTATGHELAIRYDADGSAFEIFDQNTGLIREAIVEQEDIAGQIAAHLMKYVRNPMPVFNEGERITSDKARFEVQIHP
ncbi:MAG: hypothetical protein AB7F65_00270 [Dehalococcoidia bacterium]